MDTPGWKYQMINKVSTDAKGSHDFVFLFSYQFIWNIKFPFDIYVTNIPSLLVWI